MPVRLGAADTVAAEPSEDPRLLVEKELRGSVTTEVTLEPELTAPVSRGQRLGTLTVRAGDRVLAQVPLVAAEAVERLRWRDLLVRVLQSMTMAA